MTLGAVVLCEGGQALLEELQVLCQRRLPSYGRPTRIIALTQFPVLSTGKIDRQALRKAVADYYRAGWRTQCSWRVLVPQRAADSEPQYL